MYSLWPSEIISVVIMLLGYQVISYFSTLRLFIIRWEKLRLQWAVVSNSQA